MPHHNLSNGFSHSITTGEIVEAFQQLYKILETPDVEERISQIEISQETAARKLIETVPSCKIPIVRGLQEHLPELNTNWLKSHTTGQLYNPEIMHAAMCTVNSVFYSANEKDGSLTMNERVRLYIKNLRQIGDPSVEGYALLGDFGESHNMFVVKVPQNPAHDSLLHELVVGIYGTNKLRSFLSNFSYVYGGFKCSPPIIDPDTKKVVTWCLNNHNAVNYVMYENISPGVSADTYFHRCTGKEFLNVYMQILYSLRTALEEIDFTHYDLHAGNVIVRSNPLPDQPKFQVRYRTPDGDVYLTTTVIPVIIDYGMAHIAIKDERGKLQHFGKSDRLWNSCFPNRSHIMHDVYKFLMFAASSSHSKNNWEVFEEIEKIFLFFNRIESLEDALRGQGKYGYSLPLIEKVEALSIDELIVHVSKQCDFISSERSHLPILDCEDGCITEIGAFQKITRNGRDLHPKSIIELYDVLIQLNEKEREEEIFRLSEFFQYEPMMVSHIDETFDYLRKLKESLSRFKIPRFSPHSNVLSFQYMSNVENSYIILGTILDNYNIVQFYLRTGSFITKIFRDSKGSRCIRDLRDEINQDINPQIREIQLLFMQNIKHLDSYPVEQRSKTINHDHRLAWYWGKRMILDETLLDLLEQVGVDK